MKRWLILLACCLQGLCLRAAEAMLTHEWRAETSRPAATSVTLRQGETVRLACTLVERAMPVTVPDDATSRFFWKDADADGNAYWSADAELEGNVVSFVWSPDRDAGCRRYAFFLSVESPSQGTIYRAFGLLVMQASPGFNPADLGAPDALQTVVEAVIGEIDGRYLSEESDPTVPAWAKAPEKPTYTAAEVGAAPESHAHAVSDVDGLTAALEGLSTGHTTLALAVRAGTDAQGERRSGMISGVVASPNVASGSACESVTVAVRVTVSQDYAPKNLDLVKLAQWDRGNSYIRLTADGQAAVTLNGAGSSVSAPFGAGAHTLVASCEKLSDTDTRVTIWLDGSLLQERLYTGLNGLSLLVGGSAAGYDGLTYETEILRGIVFSDADLAAFAASGLIPLAEAARMTLEKTRADIASLQSAGYLTEETDPTVPDWAKAPSKPAYAWSEITGKPATYAPSAHAHAASDISTGTLSYMRLPAAETLRRGAVYPGGGLTVNDLGRLSVIPGDGLTLTDANALAVTPGLYAPASHTHAISDISGLQDLLHSHAPQSAPFVAEGDGSVATLTVPEGLGPLLADTASAAAEAYRLTADLADWPTDGAVRDVIVRNASSALTLDADALTLADYDLLTANATLGLRFTRVGTRIVVSILWRSEL